MKPATSFRSRFAYDNLLYIATGDHSCRDWKIVGGYIRERILVPLDMKATNLTNTAFHAGDNYASPHSKVDGKLRLVDFVTLDNAAPAGPINSSAAEMAKWVLLQLNRGKFPDREGRLFSERPSREMWSPQTL